MTSFGERLRVAVDTHGRLCLGLDPHASLLAQWGLPDSAEGARELALSAVDAAQGRVGVVKPQVAFYERFGFVHEGTQRAAYKRSSDDGFVDELMYGLLLGPGRAPA